MRFRLLSKKGARADYLSICNHPSRVSSGGLDLAGQAAGQKSHENRQTKSTAGVRLMLVSSQSLVRFYSYWFRATHQFSACIGTFQSCCP